MHFAPVSAPPLFLPDLSAARRCAQLHASNWALIGMGNTVWGGKRLIRGLWSGNGRVKGHGVACSVTSLFLWQRINLYDRKEKPLDSDTMTRQIKGPFWEDEADRARDLQTAY